MDNVLLKQLINFGLSSKEAKIYLTLLELDTATVFEAAKHSGINRSSAYVVLEALKKKGLVGSSDDKKVRKYVAGSPETLLYAARAAAKNQEDIKTGIETIIPELKALHKETRHRPIVKIFEGENGAKEVYLDPFRSNISEFRSFSNPANIFERVPDLIPASHVKRVGKKIKMYLINPASEKVLAMYTTMSPLQVSQDAEALLIPEDKFKFPSDMGIYGDKVSFVSPKDNFGIIIESREIAEMLRNSFNLAWEEAKRLDKKIKERLHNKKTKKIKQK